MKNGRNRVRNPEITKTGFRLDPGRGREHLFRSHGVKTQENEEWQAGEFAGANLEFAGANRSAGAEENFRGGGIRSGFWLRRGCIKFAGVERRFAGANLSAGSEVHSAAAEA